MAEAASMTRPQNSTATRELLLKYIAALGDVGREPAVSIRSFLVLYAKFIWWEVNFLALPIVILKDFYIFFWNRFSARKKPYVLGITINYTLAAIQSLRDGEIPLLKFLTLRFVTDLFITYHIRRRTDYFALALQNQELVLQISGNDAQRATSLKVESELVEKLRTNLNSKMKLEIGLVLLLVPYLPIALKLLDFSKSKGAFVQAYEWVISPTVLSGRMFFILSSSMVYGLWVFISSFIRKREIMRKNEVYLFERRLFTELAASPISEFPLDLVGWSLFYTLLGAPIVLRVHYELVSRGLDPDSVVVSLLAILFGTVLWSVPFMYAFYRRIKARAL